MKCFAIFTNKPNLKSFESIRTRRFNSILCIFHTIYGYSPGKETVNLYSCAYTYIHNAYIVFYLHVLTSFFLIFILFLLSHLSVGVCCRVSHFICTRFSHSFFCKMGCFIIFPMIWTGLSSLKRWNDVWNQIYTMIVSKENPFCFFFNSFFSSISVFIFSRFFILNSFSYPQLFFFFIHNQYKCTSNIFYV